MFRAKIWRQGLVAFAMLVGQAAMAEAGVWVSGYFDGANLNVLPATEVDFSTMTHVMHFQLEPQSDGTLLEEQLCASQCQDTNPYSAELIYLAHQKNAKVLITIGGSGFDGAFRAATSTASATDAFVSNIMSFFTRARTYNGVNVAYDGIDIDWEPIGQYGAQYQSFIVKLRNALNALNQTPSPLLTTVVLTPYTDPSVVSIVAGVQSQLDQINVMTYPYAGTWSVWHISPLNNSPSVNGNMPDFVAQVAAAKLGFGIDFDALHFQGFTAPAPSQSTSESDAGIESTYREMMALYYPGLPGPSGTNAAGIYQWDASADAPYLSIPASSSSPAYYVTFENETSIQDKVSYAKANGLGGVIVWELAAGYRPDLPEGSRDGLMQALKAAAGLGSSSQDTQPPSVSFSSPVNGAQASGTIALSANATDNVAVASVQFQVDGANVGSAITAAPYSLPGGLDTTPLANGSHTLAAIATDSSGLKSTATISITVSNAIAAPSVAVTSPAIGTHVGSPVAVQVSVSSDVVKVALYVDGGLVTTSQAAPFTTKWYPPKKITNTPHILQTKAYTASGTSASSASVTVYR